MDQDAQVITWLQFATDEPVLAAQARKNLYEVGIGLGFLATVHADGARGCTAPGRPVPMHTETCPPPNHEDGCMLVGTALEVTDRGIRDVVVDHLRVERQDDELWPSVHTDALFELIIDRCLLMRTLDAPEPPTSATAWRAS